jgi:hypothetical protein
VSLILEEITLRVGLMVQVVEHLPSKCKALSSNSSIDKERFVIKSTFASPDLNFKMGNDCIKS